MDERLTPHQKKAWRAVVDYWHNHSKIPTVTQLKTIMEYPNRQDAFYILKVFANLGLIEKVRRGQHTASDKMKITMSKADMIASLEEILASLKG